MSQTIVLADFFDHLIALYGKKEGSEKPTYPFTQFGTIEKYEGVELKVATITNDLPVFAKRQNTFTTWYTVFRQRPKHGWNSDYLPEYFEICIKEHEASYTVFHQKGSAPLTSYSMIETPHPEINELFCWIRDTVCKQ